MSFLKAVPLSRSISLLACKFPARWIRLVCLVVFFAVVLTSLPIHVKHGNVSAQGAGFVTVYPGTYQTPDPGQGGEAISNTNNQGHGSTTVDAYYGGPSNQTKTSLWHSFPNVSGNKTRVTLKIDWSLYAYIEALGINNTGNARASYNFRIEYSLNGGSTWTSLKALSDSVAIRGEDEDIASINTGGSESVNLPNPGVIDIAQIRVRDYINGSASASGDYSAAQSLVSASVLPIRVEIAGNDAAFVSQNVPATMFAGESYAVTVSMLNQGVTTWTPEQAYRLGSQNPQDNSVWGLGRVGLPGSSVSPGATATFSFIVTAPSSPGYYNFQWRMVQDGVEWFGAMTPNIAVQVVPRNDNATFISQAVPSPMLVGATYPVSVTFQNTGNTTWTAANQYRLGSQNPVNNGTWGLGRVYLEAGESVAPGALKTFSFQVVAPSTPGSYNFQWQMLREGVLWFGEASTNISLGVTTPSCLANVPTNHWKGEYFNNINLSGGLLMVRDDGPGFLNMNFGEGSPSTACGLPTDNFSARWTQTVNFAATTYRFSVTGDDGVKLWVGGQLIKEKWFPQGATTYTEDVTFNSAGPRQVILEYFESGGPGIALLSWVDVTGVNCLPNAPLPLISSARQAGGGVNIASTVPSETPKRCGQKNSE